MGQPLDYHRHLASIALKDLDYVGVKDVQYNASWKQRGGAGAFFTIVRPWDRLESMLKRKYSHDMFAAIQDEGLEGPDGSIIACIRDIRRYLLLVEAHMTQELKPEHPVTDDMATLRGMADKVQTSTERPSRGRFGIYQRAGETDLEFRARVAAVNETFEQHIDNNGASPARPGTPEDGGHHERGNVTHATPQVEAAFAVLDNPWVMTKGRVVGQSWDMFYEQRAADVYTLAPCVDGSIHVPGFLAHLYRRVWEVGWNSEYEFTKFDDHPVTTNFKPNSTWWLDITQCPRSARAYYTGLPREQNQHEIKARAAYCQLYSWDEPRTRFVLRNAWNAWSQEALDSIGEV